MILPNLPTDNLYKFMAISGIVLFSYCLVAPFVLMTQNLERIEKVSEEAAIISADVQLLDKMLAVDPVAPGDRAGARKRLEESVDASRRNAALEAKIGMVHRLNQQNKFLMVLGSLGLLTGMGLGAAGFSLWYLRVQKYLDEQIKKVSTFRENA